MIQSANEEAIQMKGEVSQEQIAAVYPRVAAAVAGALAREPQEVKLKSRLFADLEAESIDLLDIVFRLEREFAIQIPRGRILEQARGTLSPEEFESKGVLTEAGIKRLREYLPEVSAEAFRPRMGVAEVPTLFTVETLCKMVLRAQREANGA